MSLALTLACLWAAAANLIAMFPSRHHHWPAAYGLIAIGVPLWVWIVAVDGIWIGLIVLAAAASVLRWPVRYLMRWVQRQFRGPEEGAAG